MPSRNFFVEACDCIKPPLVLSISGRNTDDVSFNIAKLACVSSSFMSSSIIPKLLEKHTIDKASAMTDIFAPFCQTLQFSPALQLKIQSEDKDIAMFNSKIMNPLIEQYRYFTRSLVTFTTHCFNEETVEKYLSKCINLRKIELRGYAKIKNQEAVLKMLPRTVEDFHFSRLNAEGLDAVTEHLASSLVRLDIAHNTEKFSATLLGKCISRLSKLQELCFSSVEGNGESVDVTLPSGSEVSVKYAGDFIGKVLGGMLTFTTLTLNVPGLEKNIDDIHVKQFVNLANVQKIDFGYCSRITDASLSVLFASSSFATAGLKVVRLWGCTSIADGTVTALFESHYKFLEDVDLNFVGTNITDKSVKVLAENAKEAKNLKFLRLAGSSITSAVAKAFADLPALQELDLNGTQIDDDAFSAFALSPLMQKNLVTLSLSRTKITDWAAKILATNIKKFETLYVMDLEGCPGIEASTKTLLRMGGTQGRAIGLIVSDSDDDDDDDDDVW